MNWSQIQLIFCVVAMVLFQMSGDTLLFSLAATVAIVNFITSRFLCIFGDSCAPDSSSGRSRSLTFFFEQAHRISGLIGSGLLIYAVFRAGP